jgi:hypothetical protein
MVQGQLDWTLRLITTVTFAQWSMSKETGWQYLMSKLSFSNVLYQLCKLTF